MGNKNRRENGRKTERKRKGKEKDTGKTIAMGKKVTGKIGHGRDDRVTVGLDEIYPTGRNFG
jgi:hypothetical protein